MPKSIRFDKRGRVLEVFPWSVGELKKNKLYHKDLVAILRDCPEPVEENWYYHGNRAYRYAPESYELSGALIWQRMRKYAKDHPNADLKVVAIEEKNKYDSADLELRIALADAGFDPDVILAKRSFVERFNPFGA